MSVSVSSASQCCARYGPIASWTGFPEILCARRVPACPRRRSWSSFGEAGAFEPRRPCPPSCKAISPIPVTAAVRLIRTRSNRWAACRRQVSFRKSGVLARKRTSQKGNELTILDPLRSWLISPPWSMRRNTLGRAIWPLLLSPERFCSSCFNPCQRLSHRRGESRMVIDIIVPCVDVAFKNQVLDGRVQRRATPRWHYLVALRRDQSGGY